MADHERIWLQPECCAGDPEGRVWCEHDAPEPCDDDVPWTEYVRADLIPLEKAMNPLVLVTLVDCNNRMRRAIVNAPDPITNESHLIRLQEAATEVLRWTHDGDPFQVLGFQRLEEVPYFTNPQQKNP